MLWPGLWWHIVLNSKAVAFAALHESLRVQVFGRRDDEAIHALMRPATEKRQGTKSREVGQRRCSGCYGDYMSGGTVKPDFTLSFVRPRRRLSSAPTVDFGRRRAQKLSRSAVAPP